MQISSFTDLSGQISLIKKYSSLKSLNFLQIAKKNLQENAERFLMLGPKNKIRESIHPLSNVIHRKIFLHAVKGNNLQYRSLIRADLDNMLNELFIEAFSQIIQFKASKLTEKSNQEEQFTSQYLISLGKQAQNAQGYDLEKPLILRLDYKIVKQRIDLNSSEGLISSVLLVCYNLSTIQRQEYSLQELYESLLRGYKQLDQMPNLAIKSKDLMKEIKDSTIFNIPKEIQLYKDLDKNCLVFRQSGETRPQFQNNEVIIHSLFENGFQAYGTGFFVQSRIVLTSSYNTEAHKEEVKLLKIRIGIKDNKKSIDWIDISKQSIQNFGRISKIVCLSLPPETESKNELQVNFIQYRSRKVQDKATILIYGLQYKRIGNKLQCSPSLESFQYKQKDDFDFFIKLKSKASPGSLIYFKKQSSINLIGIYNPYCRGVLRLNLFNGYFFDEMFKYLNPRIKRSIIGYDDRKKISIQDKNEFPYAAVGLILTNFQITYPGGMVDWQWRQGSGTLIAPNIILTCAHNVLSSTKVQDCAELIINKGVEVRFYPAFFKLYQETSTYQIRMRKQYQYYLINLEDIFVHPKYKENFKQKNKEYIQSDIAVFKIHDQTSKNFIQIDSISESNHIFWKQMELNICGYPGQSNGVMMEDIGKGISKKEEILQLSKQKKIENMIYYTIDTTPGNSGSGIFYKNEQNYRIIGVHTQSCNILEQNQHGIKYQRGVMNYGPLLVNDNLQFVKGCLPKYENKKKTLRLSKANRFVISCPSSQFSRLVTLQEEQKDNKYNKQWTIIEKDGVCSIECTIKQKNYCITVPQGSKESDQNVPIFISEKRANNKSQLWIKETIQQGFAFKSVQTKTYLSIADGMIIRETQIVLNSYDTFNPLNQLWILS